MTGPNASSARSSTPRTVQTAPRLREAGYTGPILLFSGYPPEGLATMRFPMDVWAVSKADDSTFMRLIDGYAGTPVPLS